MRKLSNRYYKTLEGEPLQISGLMLPDPDGGPYEFVECEFHPRLWEALQQMYRDSSYIRCNWAPR